MNNKKNPYFSQEILNHVLESDRCFNLLTSAIAEKINKRLNPPTLRSVRDIKKMTALKQKIRCNTFID